MRGFLSDVNIGRASQRAQMQQPKVRVRGQRSGARGCYWACLTSSWDAADKAWSNLSPLRCWEVFLFEISQHDNYRLGARQSKPEIKNVIRQSRVRGLQPDIQVKKSPGMCLSQILVSSEGWWHVQCPRFSHLANFLCEDHVNHIQAEIAKTIFTTDFLEDAWPLLPAETVNQVDDRLGCLQPRSRSEQVTWLVAIMSRNFVKCINTLLTCLTNTRSDGWSSWTCCKRSTRPAGDRLGWLYQPLCFASIEQLHPASSWRLALTLYLQGKG